MLNAVLHLVLLKGYPGRKDTPCSGCLTVPCRPCRGKHRLYLPGGKPGEGRQGCFCSAERQLEQAGNLGHKKTLGDEQI